MYIPILQIRKWRHSYIVNGELEFEPWHLGFRVCACNWCMMPNLPAKGYFCCRRLRRSHPKAPKESEAGGTEANLHHQGAQPAILDPEFYHVVTKRAFAVNPSGCAGPRSGPSWGRDGLVPGSISAVWPRPPEHLLGCLRFKIKWINIIILPSTIVHLCRAGLTSRKIGSIDKESQPCYLPPPLLGSPHPNRGPPSQARPWSILCCQGSILLPCFTGPASHGRSWWLRPRWAEWLISALWETHWD